MEYKQLISHPKYKEDWLLSSANEFGRLAQGVDGRIKGIDTIFSYTSMRCLRIASVTLLMQNLFAMNALRRRK